MKNYKNYNQIFIGESDIASLTIRSAGAVGILNFGIDGIYNAYIVDECAEIGSHYHKVYEGENWLTIFDDNELTFKEYADKIIIYRAGEMGCIIQLINENKWMEDK